MKRAVIHDKIRLLALLLASGSLPFHLFLITNIATFLLLLNWLFESSIKIKWHRLKQNLYVFAFVQLFAFYVAGLLYSQNISQGAFEIEKKLSILAFPLIFATSNVITRDDLRNILKSFIIFCTVATWICIASAVSKNYEEGHTIGYVYNAVFNNIHLPGRYYYFNYWYFTYELFAQPLGMHPVYFAMYLVFSCCIAVWLWWENGSNFNRRNIFVMLFLIYLFINIILLASRTQLFILLLLGTAFILLQSFLNKKIIRGLVSIIVVYALGLTIILSNPVSRERFIESVKPDTHFNNNKFGEGGLSLRKYKWHYAIETIKASPMLGTGTGDTQDELQKTYQKNHFKIGFDLRYNTHNQFLQTTLELGLLGLISLLISLGMSFYLALKNKVVIYFVFTTIFVISCLTESMLEVNKGIVFYSFFNALFAFHTFMPKTRRKNVYFSV